MAAANLKLQGFHSIKGGQFDEAGAAATEIKNSLIAAGVNDAIARRAAVAAFEAEMNVIIHAVAGTLSYEVKDGKMEIVVRDVGPGIEDIALAMTPGYSTAPHWARQRGWGSGLGLPNIKNNCDTLTIDTQLHEGTTLTIIVTLEPEGRA